MSIDVACRCGARFRARDHLAGKQVPCPRCAQALAIPAITADTLAPLESSSFGEQAFVGSSLPALSNPAPWAASEPDSGAAAETATRKLGWDLQPKKSMSHVVYSIVALLGACVGMLGLVVISFLNLNRGAQTSSWRETQCQITSSKVIGKGRISRGRKYEAQISYVYEVDKHRYQGSRVSASMGLQGDGRRIARKYSAGQVHPVFYNPATPSEAVLERGIPVGAWIFVVLCLVCLFASTAGVAFYAVTLLHRLS